MKCPRCDETYIHQEEVSVFCCTEDEPQMMCVSVDHYSGVATPSIEPRENCPSPRRHGLRIRFSCEICGDKPIFWSMWQHKGQTFARWDDEVPA